MINYCKVLAKKYIPSKNDLEKNRYFRRLSPIFNAHPEYWHLSKEPVARGIGIGLFATFMLFPFQTTIAILIALPLRANLPLSIGVIWINNPFTIAPIYYLCYRVGNFVLQTPKNQELKISFASISTHLADIWQPFLLGGLICGSIAGLIGYGMTILYWKYLRASD